MIVFADRVAAGQALAHALDHLRGTDVVVVGLPRGGVPVAAEVAHSLGAPLDVLMVRKLGVPGQQELAMGAIGENGMRVIDDRMLAAAGVSASEVHAIERRRRAELEAMVERLRRRHPRVDLTGRTAVIVDDGLATGSTMRAGCAVARQLGAARVIAAVPVGPGATVHALEEAVEVVCVHVRDPFGSVGAYYDDFSPTSEAEVLALLASASG